MVFLVVKIEDQREPSGTLLESVNFPPFVMPAVITSKIALWQVEHNVGGFFTLDYWKSLFNRKRNYNIIIQQKDPVTDTTQTFLLYSCDAEELARQDFNKICQTLTPLVDDCTLLLSEELLKAVILPSPTERGKLIFKITQLMESNPDGHTDWLTVLRSLVLVAIRNDEKDSEQSLKEVLTKDETSEVIGATDRIGNTAFHLAKSDKSMGLAISASEKLGEDKKKKLLNKQNREGMAPIHTAFQENKQDVVNQLVQAGANVDSKTADGNDSNSMHLAALAGSAESVRVVHHKTEGFLRKDPEKDLKLRIFQDALNATNKNGETPLMLSVRKNSIDIVVTFLEAGAEPDFQNPINGNAALHYAGRLGFTSILKALLAFGAQVNIKNKAGKTPLDEARNSKAANAKDCEEILEEMSVLTREAEGKVSPEFKQVEVPLNALFFLSMDGGGIRGLVVVQSLLAIYKRMKQLKPDCLPLQKYFDYIAGTSVGGMIASALGIVGTPLESARALMFKIANEIFSNPVTFPAEVVNKALQEAAGKDTLVTLSLKPRVVTLTVLGDRNPPVLHHVCNYGGSRNGLKPPSQWKIWESMRATSAAPVFFPPYENKFIDGGVMASNPTLDVMAEILSQEEKEKTGRNIALVVSLGTGILPPTTQIDDVGIYVPNINNFFKAVSNIGDSVSASLNFLNLMASQTFLADGQEVVQAKAWCSSLGVPYFRLSPSLSQNVGLTEIDVAILTNMMLETQKYLLRNADQVDAIASILLSRDLD